MSTRGSRVRHTISALGVLTAVVTVAAGGLEMLARRGESTGHVYPYKSEDWLRYFVPTLWPVHGPPKLMLTGPSTARENFLVEDFARAFPEFRVMPCAMSLGTFRDITAGLEYVEREYGRAALPSLLVMGISPRFLAEIPDERPFADALDRYGRHLGRLTDSSAVFGLARKSVFEGATDQLRFALKWQPTRYRSAIAWATTRILSPGASEWIRTSAPVRRIAETPLGVLLGLEELAQLGPRDFAERYIAPYRYQPARSSWPAEHLRASLDDSTSWWREVFRWDPAAAARGIRARAAALMKWARDRGIGVYVVRLPEHSFLRQRTDPVLAARFDSLIHTAFDPAPVLDLSCLLPDDEFLDAEHALWTGAKRISAHVIGYLDEVRRARAHAGHEKVKALAAEWSRGGCAFDR